MTLVPDLSMVVPIRDERAGVVDLITQLVPALEESRIESFEVILVDDGSRDGTGEILEQLCAADHRLHCVRLRRPFGKGDALGAGFDQARGSLIATIDADLQESPEELDRLLSVMEQGADMVIGWRHQRRDGVGKRISSFLYNKAVRLVGGPPLHDGNCGFKLMRKELARELPLSGGRFRFMQLVANHWGYRVREVQVSHRKRQTGNSHFGPMRAFSAALDLVVVLALLQGHSRPGILFLKWGLVSTIPGSVILAFIAYLRIFEGSIQHRFPLLALGVMLVLAGLQLLLAGVMAEWMGAKERSRPAYRVDKSRHETREHQQ